MDSTTNQTLQILMFPWLAHGHISPYLELAKKLTKRNFIIHLCSTTANFQSIKAKIGEEYAASIILVELQLTEDHLPRSLHTTNGLPPDLMPKLKASFDDSRSDFRRILDDVKPDLLIYDFLQPWAPLAAKARGIPAAMFITSSSTMNAFLFQFFMKPHEPFPFKEICYREYEFTYRDRLLDSDESVRKNALDGVRRSGFVLIKGFKEIESRYSNYLCALLKKKVVPVGALVQEPEGFESESEFITFLNNKEEKSTVFVSFGSEYFLRKEDMFELACGLELSNFNFIWVVRFPKGEEKMVLEDCLPPGFLTRVKGRGMVVEGWAPQAQILAHGSIGGFVSHCGCSSMMESMKFGVPIIAMPMHLDQPLNARLVELIGVGVEVVRNDRGELERDVIAKVIRQVVVEEELVRKKALSMSEKLEAKGDEEVEKVAAEILKLYNKNKSEMLEAAKGDQEIEEVTVKKPLNNDNKKKTNKKKKNKKKKSKRNGFH